MANIACSRNTSFAMFLIMFIIFLVSFATNVWYKDGIGGTFGLWKTCGDFFFGGTECLTIVSPGFHLIGTQAMMCMALIFNVISFICYCVWMSKDKFYLRSDGAGPVGKAALALSLIAAIDTIIAVAIFAIWQINFIQGLGWSFILAAVSGSVTFISSIGSLCETACCFTPQRAEPRGTVHPSAYPHGYPSTIASVTPYQVPQGNFVNAEQGYCSYGIASVTPHQVPQGNFSMNAEQGYSSGIASVTPYPVPQGNSSIGAEQGYSSGIASLTPHQVPQRNLSLDEKHDYPSGIASVTQLQVPQGNPVVDT